MKWMKNLYIGSLSDKRIKEVKKRIRKGKPAFGCYVLFPSTGSGSQIDLMDAKFLLGDYYRRKEDLVIIGMASGKEDALKVVTRIAEECVEATGTGNIRAYILRRLETEGTEEAV